MFYFIKFVNTLSFIWKLNELDNLTDVQLPTALGQNLLFAC